MFKFSDKAFFRTWIIFHAAVLVFFLATVISLKGNVVIDADLFNMFPRPFQEEGVRIADEQLSSIVGQNVFILVENEDFNTARQVAVQVYEKLQTSDKFSSVTLYSDLNELSEVQDFVYDYRWNLLTQDQIDLINSDDGAQVFAQNALMQAFSPFNIISLDNIDTDPFMLAETNINNFLNAVQKAGTAMTAKDSVLASYTDGKWYVMIRGILTKDGAAVASKNNGITEIFNACTPLEKDGTRFVYSGTPFYSHESSNAATKEITIISTVSMLVVIILLLIVFRSPLPILCSVCSILVSILVAICTTLAVFHKMHILTLVFGTSLIGSCIDYSLHYFTQWAGNVNLKSGSEIRKHLMSSLGMAIISSELCFAILLFAPFNMLKQMSVFSLSGLMSSFLTAIAVYPKIPLPKERKLPLLAAIKPTKNFDTKKLVGRIVVTSLFVFAIGTVLICNKNVRIENDLSRLYTMKGRMLDDKVKTMDITQYNPTGWFIVRGETEEQALNNEAKLCRLLNEKTGNNMGYISTTNFIPSIEQQKASRQACEKLLALSEEQFDFLGFDSSYADDLRAEFEASAENYISLEKGNVPDFICNTISTAWLGQIEDKYYTVVMPNLIDNYDLMCQIADESDDVFFVHKVADMARDLDKLSLLVIQFFLIAYVVMFIILKFFYNWKQALKIISIPFLIMLMTAAIFAISKIKLEFFSVTGLVLVFGLGLDYIIYMMENEKGHTENVKTLEPFATMLSFITTIISFGALALSSFQPVHLMGLSIFIGLATAYISSMFYDRSF